MRFEINLNRTKSDETSQSNMQRATSSNKDLIFIPMFFTLQIEEIDAKFWSIVILSKMFTFLQGNFLSIFL